VVTIELAIEAQADIEPKAPLLAFARNGDPQAFSQLVEPLEERLYRQAFVLCRNETTAEELAQETLIAAWKGIRRFDGNCQLFTWLYAILIRLHRKRLRTLSRKPLLFWGLFQWNHQHPEAAPENQECLESNPATKAEETEKQSEIQATIETLPKKHQEIIRLRFYASASLQEIAEVTGCSLGTVKSRLHYALEKLRQKQNRNFQ
jgi:RNA polymerase sigma-70 factor (ECF subfamily)